MSIKRPLQLAWGIMVALGIGVLLLPTVSASALSRPVNARSTTPVNASVYLTTAMLQPMFQDTINQQIPQLMTQTIEGIVSQMPQEDQDWATEMAGALLQPSATLISLTPQDKGLLATFTLSLYPGDPKPQNITLLIGFTVLNPTTLQVTSLPIDGKPGLVSGNLDTIQMPLGTLTSVAPTTKCGDSDLKINLKFPVTLGKSGTTSQVIPSHAGAMGAPLSGSIRIGKQATPATTSYIEIPAASLNQLGQAMGSIPISDTLTAKNIRISAQKPNLLVTADIYWHGMIIGTAVSTMQPGAADGNLKMHVTSTKLQILAGLISFPENSYNQQIEQMINSEMGTALAGNFTVAQAAVGPNVHLPCAANDSLLLGGELNLS